MLFNNGMDKCYRSEFLQLENSTVYLTCYMILETILFLHYTAVNK